MATDRSEQEEKWILQQEQRLLAKLRDQETEEQHLTREEREATELRNHYMKCPKCGYDLEEIDHEHIKVDRCRKCHGVWLDAGELDELLGRKDWDLLGFFRKGN